MWYKDALRTLTPKIIDSYFLEDGKELRGNRFHRNGYYDIRLG